MQNCYGLGNVTCKTGVRVTGTNPDNGQPITAIPIQSMYNIATLDRYVSYMSMKRKVMVHVKHDIWQVSYGVAKRTTCKVCTSPIRAQMGSIVY